MLWINCGKLEQSKIKETFVHTRRPILREIQRFFA